MIICTLFLLALPSSITFKSSNILQNRYLKGSKRGVKLSVLSSNSPPNDAKNSFMNIDISTIISTALGGIILYQITQVRTDVNVLKIDVNVLKSDVNVLKSDVNVLKSDVNVLKIDTNMMKTELNDLKFRFDAFGIGGAFSLAIFAGSGNIVKVLEYFDKQKNSSRK
jgi:outer membrane murein-binding lipoprotein Lpp